MVDAVSRQFVAAFLCADGCFLGGWESEDGTSGQHPDISRTGMFGPSVANSSTFNCSQDLFTHYTTNDKTVVKVFGFGLLLGPLVSFCLNFIMLRSLVAAPKLKQHLRMFLCSLTVCDLLLTLVAAPFRIFGLITENVEVVTELLCDVASMSDVMLAGVSLFHMFVLTFERFITIVHPFMQGSWFNGRNTVAMLLICWLIPAGVTFGALPGRLHLGGVEARYHCLLTQTGSCQILFNLPFAIISLIAFFILPSIGIIICTKQTLNKITLKQNALAKLFSVGTDVGSLNRRHYGSKLGRTIVTLTCCNVCIWLPFFVVTFIDTCLTYKLPNAVWLAVTIIGYSCIIVTPYVFVKHTTGWTCKRQVKTTRQMRVKTVFRPY